MVMVIKNPSANAGGIKDSIPRSGRCPGGGHSNPLQYSCLENPMDGGAWRATVHGVTESDMTERLCFHFLSLFKAKSFHIIFFKQQKIIPFVWALSNWWACQVNAMWMITWLNQNRTLWSEENLIASQPTSSFIFFSYFQIF